MSILNSFLRIFVENNNASSKNRNDTSGNREIIVKHDGRLQRITLNKYGEIIDRRYD